LYFLSFLSRRKLKGRSLARRSQLVHSCSICEGFEVDQLRKIRPLKPAKGRILPDLGVVGEKGVVHCK
jgi:hypothetical protein